MATVKKMPDAQYFWEPPARQEVVTMDPHSTRPTQADCRRMLAHAGYRGFKPSIRQSSITTYGNCKREFMFRYKLGLTGRTYSSALNIGTAYHAIMEGLMLGFPMDQALLRVGAIQREAEDNMIEVAGDTGILPSGKTIEKQVEECRRDIQKAKVMAVWTWAQKLIDLDKWDVLAVERVINVKYPGLTSTITIKADAILRRKGTHRVYILDWKTCPGSPAERATTVEFEIQPTLYRIALEAAIPQLEKELGEELEACGFIHVIVQKPTLRLKKNQEWAEYVDEISQWYLKQTLKSQNERPYYRSVIRFSGPAMTRETWSAVKEVDRASNSVPNLDRFYRDPSAKACMTYGRPCQYMPLCSVPFRHWPEIIPLRYRVKHRDIEDEDIRHL